MSGNNDDVELSLSPSRAEPRHEYLSSSFLPQQADAQDLGKTESSGVRFRSCQDRTITSSARWHPSSV